MDSIIPHHFLNESGFSPDFSGEIIEPENLLENVFKTRGWPVHFKRNKQVQIEGELAEYFYQIESGAVRSYKLLGDGRRQIIAFHLSGDLIELGSGECYCLSAAACARCVVRIAKRTTILAMARDSLALAGEIWKRAARDLRFAQDHLLGLGRKTAEEKMASFLLNLADRSPLKATVDVPMTRVDIADYLGLAIETVSRILTLLESASIISRSGHRIRLCDRPALLSLRHGEWNGAVRATVPNADVPSGISPS